MGPLYRDFGYPPFSVFDARSSWWRKSKRAWLDLGIESAQGRKPDLLSGFGNALATFKPNSYSADNLPSWASSSVFDPVLCQLVYSWFCPPEGRIIDPYAGGSVRGIVAAKMGRKYVGLDISPTQIEENRKQAKHLQCIPMPEWRLGDAVRLYDKVRGRADLVFTCPPYGNLERYSDDPADLSNMPYDAFMGCFKASLRQAAARLHEHRFMVLVVGDFRDRSGIYRGFVADTISACRDIGLDFHNDSVLITMVGTLPMRARAAFEKSRKLGKTHQNVLVFVKGDPREARKVLGNVEPFEVPGGGNH